MSKDKNDDSNDIKEINNKYISPRQLKQFDQINDATIKIQNVSSSKKKKKMNFKFILLKFYFIEVLKTLCRTDSDMSSSGYSEYRSDSWVEDDLTIKSSSLKRDKRSESER